MAASKDYDVAKVALGKQAKMDQLMEIMEMEEDAR